jgi:hypothetical protein
MTRKLMPEAACCGQNQNSFQDACQMIERALYLEISRETVREVTEAVGRRVFEADSEKAGHLASNMHAMETLPDSRKEAGTLYIMPDGAAVNTRVEDENGSTWRENKTAVVFTDKDVKKRRKKGHIITKKEYTAVIGSAQEFGGHVLNIVKAGYGKIREVVLIGDGAAWIRNMGIWEKSCSLTRCRYWICTT